MSFSEAMISLQLLAEEKIGAVMRANRDALEAQQDQASAGLRARVGA